MLTNSQVFPVKSTGEVEALLNKVCADFDITLPPAPMYYAIVARADGLLDFVARDPQCFHLYRIPIGSWKNTPQDPSAPNTYLIDVAVDEYVIGQVILLAIDLPRAMSPKWIFPDWDIR
jgi:hypothetical protein